MRGTNPAYKRELIRKFELQIIRRIPCEKPARMRKYMLTFAWFKVQVGLILTLQGETTQQYSLNFISRRANNNAFRSSAVSKRARWEKYDTDKKLSSRLGKAWNLMLYILKPIYFAKEIYKKFTSSIYPVWDSISYKVVWREDLDFKLWFLESLINLNNSSFA